MIKLRLFPRQEIQSLLLNGGENIDYPLLEHPTGFMLRIELVGSDIKEVTVKHLSRDPETLPNAPIVLEFYGEIAARATQSIKKNVMEIRVEWVNVRNLLQRRCLICR
jgi:hypothetical protein